MKKVCCVCLMALAMVPLLFSQGQAAVELNVQKTLKLTEAPLDVAVSLNGRWVFVLTQSGNLDIYKPDGRLQETLRVGPQVDQIRVGPREDLLLLSSKADKTVQIVTLDFIVPVNVSGSPFKGPADAPVVVAVFSDFQ